MNDKVKKIVIPFILMLIFNLGNYYFVNGQNFAQGITIHHGILLASGLILGPYGAFGAALGSTLCDLIRGYHPLITLFSSLISFATSYLGYKLWYENYESRPYVTNPKLNSTNNLILFSLIVLVCGGLYALMRAKLIYLIYPDINFITDTLKIRFFLTYINTAFVFGVVGIWISNKRNFFHIPKVSKKQINKRFYTIIGSLLTLSVVLTLIIDHYTHSIVYLSLLELSVISILLAIYLKKPITSTVVINDFKSIPEEVMNRFNLALLFIIILGIILSYNLILMTTIENILMIDTNEIVLSMMVLIDALLLIFFIPSMGVLRYIEKRVMDPILSLSKIDEFIHENEKIESQGLIDIYSQYVDEKNEIGILARSYTDLIKFNNYYIENIQEIEGEKERIEAELDIATRIQAANLPTDAIENKNYIVNGYSKPAREVGGDFFDYYELDNNNLAIVIGDASGKGIPAAILAMITQVMIRQMVNYNTDPSKILYLLNNQLCKHNTGSMFITLWLGIYDRTTNKLTFSNAGHEPPLIKENDEFKYLTMDSGLVLGIMEDFDYINEEITLSDEIILYTDGIIDAVNNEEEVYGEENLLDFLNELENDTDPIRPLLDSINEFAKDEDQFDDITLIYLKTKETTEDFNYWDGDSIFNSK